MTTTHERHPWTTRPLLGLRRRPGRLALWFMRLPLPLYRHGFGWLLDHVFLLIAHQGRKTGRRRETVTMAATYDPETHGVVVCSAWGAETDWIRNLRAHPALEIQVGRESYVPEQRFLSEEESVAVTVEFRRRHPWRVRLLAAVLGLGRSPFRGGGAGVRPHPAVRGVPPDEERSASGVGGRWATIEQARRPGSGGPWSSQRLLSAAVCSASRPPAVFRPSRG